MAPGYTLCKHPHPQGRSTAQGFITISIHCFQEASLIQVLHRKILVLFLGPVVDFWGWLLDYIVLFYDMYMSISVRLFLSKI
jgi:hypothetical protein